MIGRLTLCLAVLLLSSPSNAQVGLICAIDPMECPGPRGIAASCNSSNDIEWSVWYQGEVVDTVVIDNSNSTPYSENVTVNGVDLEFRKPTAGISFVWFTANPSLNGVNLTCTDQSDNSSDTCAIQNIFSTEDLPAPQNLTFNFSTITDTSISYSWDAPSMDNECAGDDYNVRLTVSGDPNPYQTKETMGTINEAGQPLEDQNQENCVSVAQRGREDGKSGMYSPEICIIIDRPLPVDIIPMYTLYFGESRTLPIHMSWMGPNDTRPQVTWYYITHNFTASMDMDGSGSGDDDDTDPTNDRNPFVSEVVNGSVNMRLYPDRLQEGEYYSFSVIAQNVLGNSSAATLVFPIVRPMLTTSYPLPTSTSRVSVAPSVTPTESVSATEDDPVLPIWAIAVIAVGGALLLAIVVAAFVIIICCCCGVAACAICAGGKKKREEHELQGTKL